MSSFRNRISKLWSRNENSTNSNRHNTNSRLVVEYPDLSSSDTTQSADTFKSTESTSAKSLHRVASRTLQAFSDTIRSKARNFYVKNGGEDTIPSTQNDRPPKNHFRRSAIWSSMRSRGSHESSKGQSDTQVSQPSPPSHSISVPKSEEVVPEITVKIPSSTLLDIEDLEDSARQEFTSTPDKSAAYLPYKTGKLWPSPCRDTLPRFPIFSTSMPHVPRASLLQNPSRGTSSEFMYGSSLFDPMPKTPDISSDVEDQRIQDLEHASARCSIYNKHGDSPQDEVRSIDKLEHSNDLSRISSQGRFISRRDHHPLPDMIQFSGLDPSLKTPKRDITPLEDPNVNDIVTQSKSIQISPIHQSNGLKARISDSYPDTMSLEGRPFYQRPASSTYGADSEPEASSPEIPSMGSRYAWEEIRADRDNRYLEIHSDTEIDQVERLPTMLLDFGAVDNPVLSNSATRFAVEANERRSGTLIDDSGSDSTPPQTAIHKTRPIRIPNASSDQLETSAKGVSVQKADSPVMLSIDSASSVEENPWELLEEVQIDHLDDYFIDDDFLTRILRLNKAFVSQSDDDISDHMASSSPRSVSTIDSCVATAHGSSFHKPSRIPCPSQFYYRPVYQRSYAGANFSEAVPPPQYLGANELLLTQQNESEMESDLSSDSAEPSRNNEIKSEQEKLIVDGTETCARQEREDPSKNSRNCVPAIQLSENFKLIPQYEVFNPDRSFNATRLPHFNVSTSSLIQSLRRQENSSEEAVDPEQHYSVLEEISGNRSHNDVPLGSACGDSEQFLLRTGDSSETLAPSVSSKEEVYWTGDAEFFDEPESIIAEEEGENRVERLENEFDVGIEDGSFLVRSFADTVVPLEGNDQRGTNVHTATDIGSYW